jgi:hypothetical protein
LNIAQALNAYVNFTQDGLLNQEFKGFLEKLLLMWRIEICEKLVDVDTSWMHIVALQKNRTKPLFHQLRSAWNIILEKRLY